MKKTIFLIALIVVGLAIVSSQQPVPKPSTPTFVTALGRDRHQSTLVFNQTQIQRLFEIYD